MVRLGVSLMLADFGLVGPLGDIVGWFLRSALGFFVMEGKFAIDLGLDSLKEAMSIPEFKEAATKEYEKATAKKYTEEEKNAIRQEYLDTLDKFTRLSGVPNNP